MHNPSPLPASWVDRIFEKLTLTYGQRFTGMWQGVDMADVKADWALELAGFDEKPHCIRFALQNLPEQYPTNALEFRAIARRAPAPQFDALPPPPANPGRMRAILAAVNRASASDSRSAAQKFVDDMIRRADGKPHTLSSGQIRVLRSTVAAMSGRDPRLEHPTVVELCRPAGPRDLVEEAAA
jgi:hypothetical protein